MFANNSISMKIKGLLILSYLLLFHGEIVANAPLHFSQQFAMPMQLNPAFAGTKPFARLSFGYRTQFFPGLDAFQSAHFSIDNYTASTMGGLGLQVVRDVQANLLQTNHIGGIYSLHLQLTHNLFMNLGLEAAILNKSLNWNNLIFADQFNLLTGEILPINEPIIESSLWVPNFATGVLLFNERFFGGLAIHNLNRPNISFHGTPVRMPLHYKFHVGTTISIGQTTRRNRPDESFFVAPNIIFHLRGVYRMINYGLHAGFKNASAGIWIRQDFRLPETIIFLIALDTGNLRISYSYDHSLSSLYGLNQGAHEVGIRFSFFTDNKKPRENIINCRGF
ncbi:MAG TPA: hypothetical protein DCM62_05950 [Bacteroidales bacterium]|nr:hypothetical protein [Bacteroidales bacterium]